MSLKTKTQTVNGVVMDENKLFQELGSIRATLNSVNEETKKIQGINESLVRQDMKIDAMHLRIDRNEESLNVHSDLLDGFNKIKNMGIGVFATVATIFGALGSWLGRLLLTFVS